MENVLWVKKTCLCFINVTRLKCPKCPNAFESSYFKSYFYHLFSKTVIFLFCSFTFGKNPNHFTCLFHILHNHYYTVLCALFLCKRTKRKKKKKEEKGKEKKELLCHFSHHNYSSCSYMKILIFD